ncbi:chemotaxis protein CheB [Haliangium ochraceum]|uniref:protein-glutamate methylesterase n=1 Tax=Haliangium ochraceum (strain DSM 14365 / JCM 11303 / SMP-2) TaxID=502025 RepID=D0LXI3_HALO1|nr:chemotaxis protein CheB [Haliangium ochraceum]ACY17738.1 CheB methylesterase [Haliangium ochraceum DSM 14365]
MSQSRDTIVIGTSSGGVSALRTLLGQLDSALPAAVLIVQHLSPRSPGQLVAVLQRATSMPVAWVDEPVEIRPGHVYVYVAPPDMHLTIREDRAEVVRGPRENRARPAINPLFRTAAAERGGRVIAVLLTGLLDDGIAGLESVRRCGGVTVVQDPDDAEFAEMPQRALSAELADHVCCLAGMGALLRTLVGQPAPASEVPHAITVEARMSGPGRSTPEALTSIGDQVPASCPECGGPLWAVGAGESSVYRCHTGHALSARALLEMQAEEVERSMWAAVRALTERAAVLERMAGDAEARGHHRGGDVFRERAREDWAHSEQARQYLLSLRENLPREPEATGTRE